MPKLYIGAPMTMISAAFNSATNSSDSAKSAFSSVVLGSPRTAVAAVVSKWGGVAPLNHVPQCCGLLIFQWCNRLIYYFESYLQGCLIFNTNTFIEFPFNWCFIKSAVILSEILNR